jgi:tetratricopeptide (TPR) repeat protein
MARNTYTEALRMAQQAQVERAARVKILHRMADMDLQSLDWRQALRIFEQIRTLQPDDLEARNSLVTLNLRLGRDEQAILELDNYLTYLRDNNQIEIAASFLEELVEEHSQLIPIRRRLVEIYQRLGRDEEAIVQLDTIGEQLMQVGDRAGAIKIIEKILSLEPANKAAYLLLLKQLRIVP